MRCPVCAQVLSGTERWCALCGEPLSEMDWATRSTDPPDPSSAPTSSYGPGSAFDPSTATGSDIDRTAVVPLWPPARDAQAPAPITADPYAPDPYQPAPRSAGPGPSDPAPDPQEPAPYPRAPYPQARHPRADLLPSGSDHEHDSPGPRPALILPVMAVLMLAVALGLGTWWLVRDTGPDRAQLSRSSSNSPLGSAPTDNQAGNRSGNQADNPGGNRADDPTDPNAQKSPDQKNGQKNGQNTDAPTAGDTPKASNLTPLAEVSAEASGEDGRDSSGAVISYGSENLTDGSTVTTWRMDGDGRGTSITFSFEQPVVLTQLALTNGYTKRDPIDGTDRYLQERRILQVTWTTDDGTSYPQTLAEPNRRLQPMPVTDLRTSTLTLTIDETTAPGDPRRDYTAISEVVLRGRKA